MRIKVAHSTIYRYSHPVRAVMQVLRTTPRDHDGQDVLHWHIESSIDGRLIVSDDPYGNIVHAFSAEGPIHELTIQVEGTVETRDTAGIVRGAAEPLPVGVFLRETALTQPDAAIRNFANGCRSGATPFDWMHRLLNRLHGEMIFDTRPTKVTTTAAEAFALGRGVCQDLTHVFVAAARHLGVPARYVSGYFHRADGVVDQEAGHAWAEAYLPDLGWIGFDPANGICVTPAHLRVAVGLDYAEAAPVRGARQGGGEEVLAVGMRVIGTDQ
jgi:transglutaminase-like putative cysteine protease